MNLKLRTPYVLNRREDAVFWHTGKVLTLLLISLLILTKAWAVDLGHCKDRYSALLVVDPFGFRSGEDIPKVAKELGLKTVMVLSRADLPPYLVASLSEYDIDPITNISVDATLDEIKAISEKYNIEISGVIAGAESGVLLSDALSSRLNLPGNGTELSQSRRDKFKMHEVLKDNGVTSSKHFQSGEIKSLLQWYDESIGSIPSHRVVVKPLQGVATTDVFLCSSREDVKEAAEKILSKLNFFNEKNTKVVIEGFHEGTEYIFDTVSVTNTDGTTHAPVGAWKYVRRPSPEKLGVPIIDYVDWVPHENLPTGLENYAHQVLNSVGIKFGPAHLEIMMTSDGPVLVEIGARLPGGLPDIAAKATGDKVSSVPLSIQSVTTPQTLNLEKSYPTKSAARIVFLSIDEDGKIISSEALKILNQKYFQTLSEFRILSKTGVPLQKTTNVTNALLRAHFVGSAADVERDSQFLKTLQAQGYFYVR